jgi:hypothetical protein
VRRPLVDVSHWGSSFLRGFLSASLRRFLLVIRRFSVDSFVTAHSSLASDSVGARCR